MFITLFFRFLQIKASPSDQWGGGGGGGQKYPLWAISLFSKIILVYYCKCCNLIGYPTHYLFLDR